MFSAPAPVDRNSLASFAIGQQEGRSDILWLRGSREVHCFGDGIVCVSLEGRLHPGMKLGMDVVGGHEQFPDVLGNFPNLLNGFRGGDGLDDFSVPKLVAFGHL